MRHELLNQFINFSINLNHHLATKYVLPNHSYIVQKQNSVGAATKIDKIRFSASDSISKVEWCSFEIMKFRYKSSSYWIGLTLHLA